MMADLNPPTCTNCNVTEGSEDISLTKSSSAADDAEMQTSTGTEQYRYRDYANVQESDEEGMPERDASQQFPRNKNDPHSIRLQKFPTKLYSILSRPEWQDIITWMPHGRSWKILKPNEFETLVMPLFFDHCNYHSFNRLVNAWSFRRMSGGPDRGSYYHDLFLRGRPQLHKHMRRLPKSHKKKPMSKEDEPDFYSMPKLDPLPETTSNSPLSTAPGVQARLAAAPPSELSALASGSSLGGAGAMLNGTGNVSEALINIRVRQQLERQTLLSSLGASGIPRVDQQTVQPPASAPTASLLPASLPFGGGLSAAGLGAVGAGALSADYYQMLLAKRVRDENIMQLLRQGQQSWGVQKADHALQHTDKQARAG